MNVAEEDLARAKEQRARAIMVWQFEDAPEALRKLSNHCGDEDWIALIPSPLVDTELAWMLEKGSPQRVETDNGNVVLISAHA